MNQQRAVSKKITFAKVLFPTLITMGLFITALFWIVIPQFENIILDRKREMIRELSYSAVSMIDNWRRREENGEITLQLAQESAIRQLASLRYGEELKDYFWITDQHPRMIVHPYRTDLNGHDLSRFKDSHQKLLFVEMVQAVNNQGEGFVDYMWQWKDDSTRIVPKLSFVKGYAPWGWIIGTGIYIEDVRHEMARLGKNIITISILVSIISSMFLFYIAFQNYQSEKKRKIAEEELNASREKYKTLVEASAEGLIMILDDQKVFYNKAMYTLLDYADDAPIELARLFRVWPDSKTFDFVHMRQKAEITEQFEAELVRRNGSLLNVFLVISPIKVLDTSGVVISVKDMSRQKEMKEALDYTKEKYLALTNQLTIGVFRAHADRNARFTEVNPALKNILGLEQDRDILTASLFDFFIDPLQADSVMEALLRDGFINNRAVALRHGRGPTITASFSAVLVRTGQDEPTSIDGVLEDISQQRKTDQYRDKLISDLHTSVLTLSQRVQGFVKPLYACQHRASIQEAVHVMTTHDRNALLVRGDDGEALGFVTDRDLRERATAVPLGLDQPVYTIMSSPLRSIRATATIYEALVAFRKYAIRRLVVKNADQTIAGLLTIDELFEASFDNFLFFIKNIENADQVTTITEHRDQVLILVRGLIEYDTNIRSTTSLITLIADAVSRRIIELAIEELGTPPAPFVFIAMGSEGREEQTLATDQDNAIIYQDVAPETALEVQNYFQRLGERVCNHLAAAGYRFCTGNRMAKNPSWSQPFSVWKRYFTDWITTSGPKDLLDVKIYFDFRAVYGQDHLAQQLREHIHHVTSSFDTFFIYMIEGMLGVGIPEAMQKLKAPVDLKLLLLPIVDVARLYAVKYKLEETNTSRRLAALQEQGLWSPALLRSVSFCYNFIMQLRFRHQRECYEENRPVDNIIDPQKMTDLESMLLRRHLDLLEEIKNKISLDFKGSKLK